MRRILLDENLPRKLRRELSTFVVRTVQDEGWASFANGDSPGQVIRVSVDEVINPTGRERNVREK